MTGAVSLANVAGGDCFSGIGFTLVTFSDFQSVLPAVQAEVEQPVGPHGL